MVNFSPVSTGTPLSYVLHSAPGTPTVPSQQVGAHGPFTFTVTGLSCAQTYAFTVTAVFGNGQKTSTPAAAQHPCTAPGQPGNLTATPVDQGINVSWSPAAANGGTVTYTVAWSGAVSGSQPGVSGTSFHITGLTNQKSYTVSVTAVSAVGQTPASTTVTLSLPAPVVYHIYNNSGLRVNMRDADNTGGNILTWFNPNSGLPVTVRCQMWGGYASDPPGGNPNLHGNIWDYVTGTGSNGVTATGWVSDLYVNTPQSQQGNYNMFSNPPLWHCQ